MVSVLSLPATVAEAAVFTVTTNDGGVPAVNGQCSLREAIQNASNNAATNADCPTGEAAPNLDEIHFNIGGGGVQTILPSATFVDLVGGPLTIDGTTQPGPGALPRITLDGVGAGGGVSGFPIRGSDVTIRGFAIVNFNANGIRVSGGAQRTIIEGNHIGVDRTGLIAQANGVGVSLDTAFQSTIGGVNTSQRNLISGNTGDGVEILGVSTATIQGNRIGTDVNGTAAIPNGSDGVGASGLVTGVTVGGTAAGAGNLISGNIANGVFLNGNNINSFTIQGNRIGTNLDGTAALPNLAHGVFIGDAESTLVGGTAAGAGNLISGNSLSGVFMDDNANFTRIQGNLIGLNAAGTGAIPNQNNGVRFADATGDVGDGTAAGRNIISGNVLDGVHVGNLASNVGIRGNFIGTNQAGTAAVPNDGGIRMFGTNHAIGGNTAATGNLISGNDGAGIFLNTAQLVDVRNNLIGTDATGTLPIPNGTAGIAASTSSRIEIGDAEVPGRGNTVAFNAGSGVTVSADSDRIAVVDNRIFSNGLLGVELLSTPGVDVNDPNDADGGANTGQNFPVILTAFSDATLVVTGTLHTTPNTAGVRVQVFSSAACDPSGNGEGQRFLGETLVGVDGSGSAAWQLPNLPPVGVGAVITSTASSPSGTDFNTSEFSACFVAAGSPVPPPAPDPNNNDGAGGGKPKNEKEDAVRETETQRQQRERTNALGSDDYHTEGNVVAVDLEANPRTATIATRDGLQVVVLLCRDSCDDPQVDDYLEAEGEKEHEGRFYADSARSRRVGR